MTKYTSTDFDVCKNGTCWLTLFIVLGFRRFNKRQRREPSFKMSNRKISSSRSLVSWRCSKRPKATNQLTIWRGLSPILKKIFRWSLFKNHKVEERDTLTKYMSLNVWQIGSNSSAQFTWVERHSWIIQRSENLTGNDRSSWGAC